MTKLYIQHPEFFPTEKTEKNIIYRGGNNIRQTTIIDAYKDMFPDEPAINPNDVSNMGKAILIVYYGKSRNSEEEAIEAVGESSEIKKMINGFKAEQKASLPQPVIGMNEQKYPCCYIDRDCSVFCVAWSDEKQDCRRLLAEEGRSKLWQK